MHSDLLNITLGFIEGFALILSPCILPILPLILAGSLGGRKNRPFGIIAGFIVIFSLFTLFARQLVAATGLDLNIVRYFSYALLLIMGLIMLSSSLSEQFGRLTQGLTKTGSQFKLLNNSQSGFVGGFLFGSLVALIWTPCAGPILAAVIVQTVLQQTNLMSFLTTFAFALGAAIPMLLIVIFGRQLMGKASFLKTHSGLIRKSLGAIIIASVVYMVMSEGSIGASLAAVEESNTQAQGLEKGLPMPVTAPPLVGLSNWINSPPLSLDQLHGKVVLIDFWTYSCINCLRTLPYLKDWYKKYHNQGLVIIGIHTPEFDFEKNPENVKAAVKKDGIEYPVALDNQFGTWQSYSNRYWPAHYLINQNGEVVYVHFGEGDYEVTENNIRFLLGLQKSVEIPNEGKTSSQITPETYLGKKRAEHFASPEAVHLDQAAPYSFPSTLKLHHWALQGQWMIQEDRVLALSADATVKIHFKARKLFMVMGSKDGKAIPVELKLDAKALDRNAGKDVKASQVAVTTNTIYELLDLKKVSEGSLEIHPLRPGLEIYTFTFGD